MNNEVKVYIAGPLTIGDTLANIGKAIAVGQIVHEAGGVPFVPAWGSIAHLQYPWDHDTWMRYDLCWLALCECLYRIPGESKGADQEVAFAHEKGILVYHDLDEVIGYIDRRKRAAL